MNDTLKECPCGHDEPVEVVGVRSDRGFGVRCGLPDCGWRAVGYPTRELARADWNARKSPRTDGLAEALFAEIAHGDEEHRAWLKAKLDAWFTALRTGEATDV